MFVLMHVIIALSSIALTAVTLFMPTAQRLRVSSGLVGLTIATGTYLVIISHSSMLSVCLMGLFYIGGMLSALLLAQRRLATEPRSNKID